MLGEEHGKANQVYNYIKINEIPEWREKAESYSYKRISVLANRLLKNIAPKSNSDYAKFVIELLSNCEREGLVIWTKK